MFSYNIDSQTISKNKLKRFKSHNQVISYTKNIQLLILSPPKFSKHGRLSKSRSKSRLIENKLFASAKKIDDKATLLASSTVSEQSHKMQKFLLSGLTKSVSKKSLFNTNSKKIRVKNVKSQQFTSSTTDPSDHQLSIIIKEHTMIRIDNEKQSFPFIDDESSITYYDHDLGLNSEIEELNQSVQNDLTFLKMVK